MKIFANKMCSLINNMIRNSLVRKGFLLKHLYMEIMNFGGN